MANPPKDVFDVSYDFEDGWCSDKIRTQPYDGRSWLDPEPLDEAQPTQDEAGDEE